MATMQDMAQTWERPIFASGGALGYAKCFWWLIDWDWTDGIPKLRNIANTPEEISLTSGLSPTSQVITQLEAFFEALQALGVMFAPSANPVPQFEVFLTIVQTIASRICNVHFTRCEAHFLHDLFVISHICYPLACSTMSLTQCHRIDKAILPLLISKMGYNRNSKKAILHGPSSLGAAGLPTI